jgi:hypothetical protein
MSKLKNGMVRLGDGVTTSTCWHMLVGAPGPGERGMVRYEGLVPMCGLCGMFGGGDHWTDQSGSDGLERAAERRHRVEMANLVLEPFGVRCTEWQGRLTVAGRTGCTLVVDHLGALWPAAEKLAGRAIDPLDPSVIERVEQRGP